MDETKTRRALAAILVLAAGLRGAAVLTVGDVAALHGDESYYVAAAQALHRGLGYPDSARPPGFPFFVASVFAAFGESLTAVRLAQVLLSLVTVAAVFAIARRRFGPRPAVAASLLCAMTPELVHYTHFLWAETLFTTLLVLSLWALDRFESSPNLRWAALAGLCLGLAALTREMIVPFSVVAAAWVWWVTPEAATRRWRGSLALLGACALVILPWTARNYARHHQVVLVSTVRWFAVAVGNMLPPDRSLLGRQPDRDFATRYFAIPDELEREAMARGVALQAIADAQPWWIVRKATRTLYGLLTPWTQLARFEREAWLRPRWQRLASVLVPVEMVLAGLVLATGAVGLWTVRAGRLKPLLVVLLLFFAFLYVAANANHRFRVPLLPIVALFGGAFLADPASARRERRFRAGAALSVAALVLVAGLFLVRGPESDLAPAATGPPPPRRSIVLVSIDTLRASHLGAYGYPRPTSPHLDALAAEGTLFEHAYSPTSWTLPGHASMLSGLTPYNHGAVDSSTRIGDHVPLIADLLRARGYHTFGAVGAPFVSAQFGFGRGFERWLERRKSGTDPERYQAELLKELGSLEPPFFAFLHYMSVHNPYAPPAEFNRFLPPGAEAARDVRVGRLSHLMEQGAPAPTPAERDVLIALYDGEILAMDDRLSRTLAAVRQRAGEDVLVVVTSDHGEEFLDHGGLIHGRTLYDELLHVPLIIRGPGFPAGRRVPQMVSLVDIVPTLLDWSGLQAPERLDGRSLLPLLRDDGARGIGLLPLHTRGHDKSVELWGLRSPNAKLIVDQRTGRKQFYDLTEDPGERRNLYPDPRAVSLERGIEALRLQAGPVRQPLSPAEIEALNALGYR